MEKQSAQRFLNDMGEFWKDVDESMGSDCFQLSRQDLTPGQCGKISEIASEWLPFQEDDLPFLQRMIQDISGK